MSLWGWLVGEEQKVTQDVQAGVHKLREALVKHPLVDEVQRALVRALEAQAVAYPAAVRILEYVETQITAQP